MELQELLSTALLTKLYQGVPRTPTNISGVRARDATHPKSGELTC